MNAVLSDSGRITQKTGLSRWVELTLSPGYLTVRVFRLSMWLHDRGGWFRILSKAIRNLGVTVFSCDLAPSATVGGAMLFPHPVGIVIGKGARIGVNATIYQHVTIGAKGGTRDRGGYPTIGDDVTIYPGAVIVGDIRIGSRVTIGANSVVLSSIDEDLTVAGIPARVIDTDERILENQSRV